MLIYEYINPLIQFGYEQYDLCISDGGICVARFTKTFPAGVSEIEMSDYAANMMSVTEAAMALSQQEVAP